jgi:hypothetical protein
VHEGARLLTLGEDLAYIAGLERELERGIEVTREARLHALVLKRLGTGLAPGDGTPAGWPPALRDELTETDKSEGVRCVDRAMVLLGSVRGADEVVARLSRLRRLQLSGPSVYTALLSSLGSGDPDAARTFMDWLPAISESKSKLEFIRSNEAELQELLQRDDLFQVLARRLEARAARTKAKGGLVKRYPVTVGDFLVGFTALLLDRLQQASDPAAWMGELVVIEPRVGTTLGCWIEGQRFELSPSAADLLKILGVKEKTGCDDRQLNALVEQVPLLASRLHRTSVQGDHRTTVRGIALVGTVLDLGTA